MNQLVSRDSPATEPSTIRAFFLTPLIRALGKSGIEIDGFLRRFGLSSAQLTSLYERVPLRHFVAIAENLSERLDRPFLGVELGEKSNLADLGPFYAMFILARDLKSALHCLSRFQSTWQTNTTLDIMRGRQCSTWSYCIRDPAIWPRRQDAEFALTSFVAMIRQLTSKRWHPVCVEFEHDVRGRRTRLSEFFRAPVCGNRDANILVISNEDMDQVLHFRPGVDNGDLTPILERHLMELLAPEVGLQHCCADRVRELLARRLGRAAIHINDIAAEMNTTVRTLRRHLMTEGTSFRCLLKERRQSTIEAILRSPEGARLSALASRLGYSDSAVLSRAFKGWTGLSPRQYKKSRSA